jgi:SAM-dependent methyltransferase
MTAASIAKRAMQRPPQSRGGLRDFVADLRHGAPRRVITDGVARFGATVPKDAKVLEVGAGHYDHQPFFETSLVRLDFDASHGPDIVGDAHDMPIADDEFDYALAISVLEHVHDPYQVVRELYRVVKPGGRVFAWVPFIFGVHGFPGDISRFTDEGFTVCFERAGFQVEHAASDPYAGFFFNFSNWVHFVLPRRSGRRWVRGFNQLLFLLIRPFFVLDRRLKVRTMYAGTEILAVKPE